MKPIDTQLVGENLWYDQVKGSRGKPTTIIPVNRDSIKLTADELLLYT